MSINSYLEEIFQYPLLSREEEKTLAAQAKTCPHAKDRLIQANLRLVVKTAKPFERNGNLMDLVQEGNIGLIKAVEHFKPEYGYRFQTYAPWWIEQAIFDSFRRADFLPENIRRIERRMTKAIEDYYAANNNVPSDAYLSEASVEWGKKLAPEKIREYRALFFTRTPLSLDQDASYDNDTQLHDSIGHDPQDEIIEKLSQNNTMEDIVRQTIDSLDLAEPEKDILHGMTLDGKTYQDFMDRYGYTREQVRKRHTRDIRLLRHKLASHDEFSKYRKDPGDEKIKKDPTFLSPYGNK